MSFFKSIGAMVGFGSKTDVNDEKLWTEEQTIVHQALANVTADSVIQIPCAFACLKTLSDTVGSLPMVMYKKGEGNRRDTINDDPVAKLFNEQPNNYQDACELRKALTWDMCLHGNAYGEIKGIGKNSIGALHRHHPSNVRLESSQVEGYVFVVKQHGGIERYVSRYDMLHVRCGPLTENNIIADSVVNYGQRIFAKAQLLEDYSSRFFKNDATPGGIVTLKDRVANVEQARDFQKKWQGQFTGSNRHKVSFLDMGAEYNPISIPNDKAQFLETMKECQLDILRLFRMPPHKVQILDKATFSNIEEQSLSFVTDTLLPLLVAWEKAIKRQLKLADNKYLVHNVSGLLRGDIETRYKAYALGRNWGFLSVNDIRAKEDMSPIENGDSYLQPLNMVPAGNAMNSKEIAAHLEPKIIEALEYKRV